MIDNITVVIRSVHEKTEKTCYNLIKEQINIDNIYIVHEIPFSAALKKAVLIGIEKNNKWTILTDADVLITKNAIKTLIDFAYTLPQDTFKIVPYFIDKFFNTYRGGGIHLYNTSLLPQAIKFIPEEGVDLRPESQMFLNMQKKGYRTTIAPFILAIHDYDQYYNDIFRKCYIHAHKWIEWLPQLLPYWREMAGKDKDFQVALWGVAAGIATNEDIRVNKDLVPYELLKIFSKDQIIEKDLKLNSLTNSNEIDEIILNYQDKFNLDLKNEKKVLNDTIISKQQQIGHFKYCFYLFGDFIEKIGRKIKWILK